jgi:hypothetical protein
MELESLFIFLGICNKDGIKTPLTKSLLPIIYQYYAND